MKKLALTILAGASIAILSLAAAPQADAGDACARKEFKTELVKKACEKGGQAEAKKVMKKFMASAKKVNAAIKNCKSCHEGLKPDYKLTKDGLKMFKDAGGK